MKIRAFTLAEVLITLGVIGVVAAISLPRFIDNMTERANSERHANIAQKVTQAMEQMRAHGLLNTLYPTTEAFVDELQKYLKIAKRCDAEHIANCWPAKTVTAGDGKRWDISTIKTGKMLKLQTTTNNVGLVLADGASIILNYDPSAKTIDIGDKVTANMLDLPVGNGKSKNFAYTSDVTSSIDFIMDVNGSKKPNSETVNNKMHDIRSFNHAKINGCTGTDIPNIGCVVEIKTYEPETDPEKSTFIKAYDENTSGCTANYSSLKRLDYWQGAVNACHSLGSGYELPNKATLISIYEQKNKYPSIPKSGWYWTSDNGLCAAGFINFANGTGSSGNYKDSYWGETYALCVK